MTTDFDTEKAIDALGLTAGNAGSTAKGTEAGAGDKKFNPSAILAILSKSKFGEGQLFQQLDFEGVKKLHSDIQSVVQEGLSRNLDNFVLQVVKRESKKTGKPFIALILQATKKVEKKGE